MYFYYVITDYNYYHCMSRLDTNMIVECIFQVASAYYGQFYEPCNTDCCVPDVDTDCSESVEENSPGDWELLTSQCNHENYCEISNGGGIMQSCTPTIVDYLLINYNCTPSMPF